MALFCWAQVKSLQSELKSLALKQNNAVNTLQQKIDRCDSETSSTASKALECAKLADQMDAECLALVKDCEIAEAMQHEQLNFQTNLQHLRCARDLAQKEVR